MYKIYPSYNNQFFWVLKRLIYESKIYRIKIYEIIIRKMKIK